MGIITLFYKYVLILDPKNIAQWQKDICDHLSLKGRIIIATEGINGCIGGTVEAIKQYQTEISNHPLFNDIDFKESSGSSHDFPRMKVMIKKEIVHLGLDTATIKAENSGIHLEPKEAHQLFAQNRKDVVVFDCRNDYESAIGTFVGSVQPKTKYFRELPTYIDNNIDIFKNKNVVMFCTGGVRCERASAYLKSKNSAKEVYQIKGGIHRYVEQFPNGFFRGKNYVFDGRIALKVTADLLGNCILCNKDCDEYNNCLNAVCNKQYISCQTCLEKYNSCCSIQCQQLVENQQVPTRPKTTISKNAMSKG